jgi:hypothetical protein
MQNFYTKIWKEPFWKTKPEMGDNLVNETNLMYNLFFIIINSFYSLWSTGHQ